MREQDFPFDSGWDSGVYGTGCTEPPKSHRALVAVLLVAVIFLGGIATAMSLLNMKLFRELNRQETQNAVAFSMANKAAAPAETEPTAPLQEKANTVAIHAAPAAVQSGEEGGMSLQDIYKQNIQSVVSITATGMDGDSTGSGVILSGNGYLVTNNHVIEDAQQIHVRLTDERELTAAVVGTDPVSDLAVLYIQAEDLTPAQFGDSDALEVGESVVAIGDPLGVELRGTLTDGIVSAINRGVRVNGRTMNLIQTNAALNSGNSGGPLINKFGQVIGINTMKIGTFTDKSGVEGLGFAIPSGTVQEIVNQIICQGYVSGRPWLGLKGEKLSPFYQRFYRVPAGLYVTQVDSGSPADTVGIMAGDIVTQVNGQAISGMDALNELLYASEVGDSFHLTIYRGGYQSEVDVALTENKG